VENELTTHTTNKMCEGKTWKDVGWKQKKKANLYCTIEFQECTMAQLGNTQVEDKKEKKVFVALLNCKNAQQ
jgi:hypothetical protein